MSKKVKNSDLSPKDRFGQLYIAYKAKDQQTCYNDVQQLVKNTNQQLNEVQQDFLFLLINDNKTLSFPKFNLVYKLIIGSIFSNFNKKDLTEVFVNKVSTLLRKHPNFEYEHDAFTSDLDDVNFHAQLENHDQLNLKDVLIANDIFNQVQLLGKPEEDQKASKKPVKKFMMQFSIEEAQQIVQNYLKLIQNVQLYRSVFDESFTQVNMHGYEMVSPVHIPYPKQLVPLSQGYVFKQKTELEQHIYSIMKPKAAQLYKDMVTEKQREVELSGTKK